MAKKKEQTVENTIEKEVEREEAVTEINEILETDQVLKTNAPETAGTAGLNQGQFFSVRDHMKAQEEKRKRYEAEKAIRQANPTGSRISRLKVMADTPYLVKFLHDYDKGLELFVHMWRGDEPCNEICKLHYGEPCDICQTVGTRFGESYHVPMRCFLGWVYNNVGGTFTKKDERSGEIKTFNLNPIKLVQIPLGKEDANIVVLQQAARKRYFTTDVWQVERKKGKGFSVPKTIEESDLRKMIGREVPLNISEAALKIESESKLEIMKMILSAFDNVRWEALNLTPPGQKPETAELTEAPAKTGSHSGSVSDGLD